MRDDLPRMIYKYPGPYEIWGEMYDYMIVFTDEELASALANGWAYTPYEAKDKATAPLPTPIEPPLADVPADPPVDDAPPTRSELEQKASDLGIAFDGRTSNKTLAAKINAALEVV